MDKSATARATFFIMSVFFLQPRAFADVCTKQAALLSSNIEDHAWDGEWYRRAVFDNGIWLGSQLNDECKIDAICQSWAVLSNHALPNRANKAMKMASQYLIRKEFGLALLFTPPFEKNLFQKSEESSAKKPFIREAISRNEDGLSTRR